MTRIALCFECLTWRGGWQWLLKWFGEEVKVLATVEGNRNFHLARLAQLVTPLWATRQNITHTQVLNIILVKTPTSQRMMCHFNNFSSITSWNFALLNLDFVYLFWLFCYFLLAVTFFTCPAQLTKYSHSMEPRSVSTAVTWPFSTRTCWTVVRSRIWTP